jgi:Rps23 Pro-64 3,4-dihydroxylase Tpa1-like proline 4-hydroxylase
MTTSLGKTSPQGVDTALELNPALDRAALGNTFRRNGRVHIPSVLVSAAADRVHRCLTRETTWSVTFNNGPDFLDLEYKTLEERSRLALSTMRRAAAGFHYVFDNHRLSRDGEAYPDETHYFARVVEFLNSPHVLRFVRDVTGLEAIAWMDAQATLYRPGDFLTMHDDRIGGHKRLAAYVLNMTPYWRAEWGGVLQFIDPSGHIETGYVPAFNALNIFRVPMLHSVSQVAIFGGLRYSITGWFHAR